MKETDLKELYETYSDPIFRYLQSRTGSEDLAFDLMQETFIKADAYYKDVEHIKAWLFTIARNLMLDHMKKSTTRKEFQQDDSEVLESLSSGEELQESVDWKMLKDSILKTLAKENSLFPELFLLRLNENMTHKEISGVTEIPFRTIRRHFEKIRNVIYQNFKDELNISRLQESGDE